MKSYISNKEVHKFISLVDQKFTYERKIDKPDYVAFWNGANHIWISKRNRMWFAVIIRFNGKELHYELTTYSELNQVRKLINMFIN